MIFRSASRPKKNSASPSPYGTRPLYGESFAATGAGRSWPSATRLPNPLLPLDLERLLATGNVQLELALDDLDVLGAPARGVDLVRLPSHGPRSKALFLFDPQRVDSASQ